jgi:hypothetical protein
MTLMDPCDKCKAITRGGKVAYYICRNHDSKHFNTGVSIPVHDACQRKRRQLPPAPESAKPPETPGLARRVWSYAEALIEWAAAGKPERADKEVERIFNQCCKKCGWFDPEKQICRGCGCRVAEGGFALLNKIKMATEHCPLNLW